MKTNRVLWGLALIVVGVIFGLNAMGYTDINIFFDGWWTLFIIVPCVSGLLRGKEITGNLWGLAIGLVLLGAAQGLLDFRIIRKLAFPAILVICGAAILVKAMIGDRGARKFVEQHRHETGNQDYWATFSSQNLSFSGERFRGVKLTAVFGGIKCDLRGALLETDVVVDATAIFGGVTIIVPQGYRVRLVSNSIFGGVSEDVPHASQEGLITVFVNGNCLFGGVNVK